MGVLTLKEPVNCEDLRHETVPPSWPRDTGSPGECELSMRSWAETSERMAANPKTIPQDGEATWRPRLPLVSGKLDLSAV